MTCISDAGKDAVSLNGLNARAVPTVGQGRGEPIPCQDTNKGRQGMGIRIENTIYGAVPVIICDYWGARIHAA
jgi:hypothetical protein